MTKVQMDGRTFDFAIDTSLLEVDSTNPGSTAERDTLVRRQLAKWSPATADAQLEWGTSPDGEVLITVSRQAKTKGQDSALTLALSPALDLLLNAPQEVPEALTLTFALKAMELTGRLDAPTLLALQGRIERAKASASQDAEYGSRVLRYLEAARPVPGPWTPIGF